ncbi:MAG: glycosyltransferase family 4 protein [Bacteroidota bacterium]
MIQSVIYYGYPSLSSFVKTDIDYLSKDNNVIHRQQPWSNKLKLPFCLIAQFFFLLKNYRKIDVVIVSFAGYHSYLPIRFAKMKGIPSFIVLNGTDSVGIPQLSYGSHLKKIMRLFCKWSIKHAKELWPVSSSLIDGGNTYLNEPLVYGIKHSFPEIKTPFYTIPNGFNIDYWKKGLQHRKDSSNGAVSVVSGAKQFELKGIDLLLEAAERLSEIPFSIVGMTKPEELQVPENVHFLGRLTQEELRGIYASNLFYMQLSSFEGFGCSLCEAMLSGCIPIGSAVNVIPEIMGDTGFVLEKKQPDLLVGGFLSLMNVVNHNREEHSKASSDRITERYTIERRMKQIAERIAVYQNK